MEPPDQTPTDSLAFEITVEPGDADRAERMGHGPLGRLLLVFSGPAIVAMASGAAHNVIDAAFVGRLGAVPLAAVTAAFPPMLLIMAVATGTGVGAASVVGRALGAGDREGARRTAGNVLVLVALWGALTPLLMLPLLDPLLRLCGASDEVLPQARSYLGILAASAVVTFFIVSVNHVIRAEGRTLLPMVAQVSSSVVNIALDPVFIFALGLGVRGAAWATVIARCVGLAIQAWFLLSRRSLLRPRPRHLVPDAGRWWAIYRVGAASIVRSAVQAGIMGLVNGIAASFGDLALAAVGIVMRLTSFVMMPVFGLTQGYLPLVSFNFGAGNLARVRRVTLLAAGWGLAATSLASAAFIGLPGLLVLPFAPDAELAALAARSLRLFSLGMAPAGAMILFSAFFQGIGRGLPALVLSSSRQLLFLLPALLILPRFLALDGLFLSQPVADILSLVLSVAWITYQFRRMGMPILRSG